MKFLLISFILFLSLIADTQNVSVQLLWKHQFQFAGFYAAKEMGFYDEVGLTVDIKEYYENVDIVQDVVDKKTTFAVGRSSILIDKSHNQPIATLGVIFQSSPAVLITTDPNIQTLSDLKNKRIMITPGSVSSASIFSMLQSNGIESYDLRLQDHSFNIKDLVMGKTDAISAYISNEPYYLTQHNIDFKIFNPKKYGYDFYGDILFTSNDEIKNNPKKVEAFYRATKKGWLWAFEHMDESIIMIQKKYNTQNKSKQALLYEAKELKKLAFTEDMPFGHISNKKIVEIVKNYKLAGFIHNYNLKGFVDPLNLNKINVKIGVLSKRGNENTYKRWNTLTQYLNDSLEQYHFEITPLDFTELEIAIAKEKVDFVITNPTYYAYLEDQYRILRVATLLNSYASLKHNLKRFGGVIITQKNNDNIHTLKDLESRSFAAVDQRSFGGWIMAYELFSDQGLDIDTVDVQFIGTHDAVVQAVLKGEVQAGTVRTDTLEKMLQEGLLNMDDIRIIHPQKYQDFPFLVSTKLYPEWPFSKLRSTSDELSLQVLSKLVNIPKDYTKTSNTNLPKIEKWSIPADYTLIHQTLKKLHYPPYDIVDIDMKVLYREYALYLYPFILFFIIFIVRYFYVSAYNRRLNTAVKQRTLELQTANEKLQVLATTDPLTGISNRRSFMEFIKKYADIAKRNNTALFSMSLDLDYFKNINDTYGHQIGDEVLISFTQVIASMLRKSDLFGRVGGEEFCISMQNTSEEGAFQLAERICQNVASMQIPYLQEKVTVTVSIGIASLNDGEEVESLLKRSDEALYEAKENGRNRVVLR